MSVRTYCSGRSPIWSHKAASVGQYGQGGALKPLTDGHSSRRLSEESGGADVDDREEDGRLPFPGPSVPFRH